MSVGEQFCECAERSRIAHLIWPTFAVHSLDRTRVLSLALRGHDRPDIGNDAACIWEETSRHLPYDNLPLITAIATRVRLPLVVLIMSCYTSRSWSPRSSSLYPVWERLRRSIKETAMAGMSLRGHSIIIRSCFVASQRTNSPVGSLRFQEHLRHGSQERRKLRDRGCISEGEFHSSDHQEKEHGGILLDEDPVYTYAEQRKIIHRLDRRLITTAGIIYMNSLMDRSNLPNAAIAGLDDDLGMVEGLRYVSVCKCRNRSRY